MQFVLIAFVGVLVIVLGAYFGVVVRPENEEHRKLQKRLKSSTAPTRTKALGLVKEVERMSSVEAMDGFLTRMTRCSAPLQRLIDQSGVRMTVSTFLLASGCAALGPFLTITLLTGQMVIGLAAGALGSLVPYLWLKRARRTRLWKFEEHFPEAIDLIARALRSGHAFPTGLVMVADEIPNPVGAEFKLLFDRQNFGMPLPEAMRDFAKRVPVLDAQFFVTAVLTQREAGGNLAEVLDNLATVIRDRFKVKRQVRVISAHGRITGWVLAGLPPALSVAFFIASPKHMQTLLNDQIGVQMLGTALVLQVVGTLIIRKIVDIEY